MLDWLYTAIAFVMKTWHGVFSTFLPPEGGITWALSIVFLVVTVRLILFPLFVKQVKSQRAMQEIQPEIQKLRKQYGADRQGFSQAMMALQKERGVNPLAGCLPIVPQIPVFLSLFHVLRRLRPGAPGLYSWDDTLTDQAAKAELFGAPISSSFNMTGQKAVDILALPGVSSAGIRTVALILMVIMCVTTFITQKQIMRRSGPVEGQAAMVQKLLLYGMPVSLFVTGFFFPIGVLLYWMTNNLWTLGQQFFILRKLPPPGSPAALAKAAADKPPVDPRTLAPKPGAKPVRTRGGRPATTGVDLGKDGDRDAETPAPGVTLSQDAAPAGPDDAPPASAGTDGTAGATGTGGNGTGGNGTGSTASGASPGRAGGGGKSGSRPANRAPHGRPAGTGGKRKRR
ncbi:YidC/Oxa1 family membrane protein insertase [Geodermatophilus tzadiensis]|uniref:Membrane protein insertase YidC n=1 Tax=Geodermatophilus tzadiensis TaxID=1137988 RepID=A0A2T0SYU1_9ACTN|nr:membrane protein insertase YidC [Geodermatophilus tzadiensis]PRY38578.1 YidC/Oxa1 family membrane protein insertase [Geodermatophilus tzadiensis]